MLLVLGLKIDLTFFHVIKIQKFLHQVKVKFLYQIIRQYCFYTDKNSILQHQ